MENQQDIFDMIKIVNTLKTKKIFAVTNRRFILLQILFWLAEPNGKGINKKSSTICFCFAKKTNCHHYIGEGRGRYHLCECNELIFKRSGIYKILLFFPHCFKRYKFFIPLRQWAGDDTFTGIFFSLINSKLKKL